eukprot:jgi/Chrzof1/11385/Cz05g34250.t1
MATVSGYAVNGKTYYAALFIGKLSGVWDHVWGKPSEVHDTYETGIAEKDFCPSWISAFSVDDEDYYNSLWEKPTKGCLNDWLTDHEIVGVNDFQDKVDEHIKAGYRLFWVTGFGSTDHKFATIWKKERLEEGWAVHHNMRAADLQKQITKYLSEGWQPVLIDGYAIKGTTWYVAIFEPVGDDGKNTGRYGMTESEYQSYVVQQICAGYTPVHISAWTVGKEIRFSAIWKK